jgi:ATP-dependent DNA helicase DinG
LVGQRLGYPDVSGLDLLELFAFIHPARFAVPTVSGLARPMPSLRPTPLRGGRVGPDRRRAADLWRTPPGPSARAPDLQRVLTRRLDRAARRPALARPERGERSRFPCGKSRATGPSPDHFHPAGRPGRWRNDRKGAEPRRPRAMPSETAGISLRASGEPNCCWPRQARELARRCPSCAGSRWGRSSPGHHSVSTFPKASTAAGWGKHEAVPRSRDTQSADRDPQGA